MLRFRLIKRDLPLRFLWKISRGALETKQTYFLTLEGEDAIGWGEISPNTRYHNTPERIEADFERLSAAAAREAGLARMSPPELERWLRSLELCRTLSFGVESALLQWQAARAGRPLPQVFAEALGLPVVSEVRTSFSVPIMDPGELAEFIRPLQRYYALKIKVDARTAVETIREVTRVTDQKLRIDGNEDWTDVGELLRFVETLKGKNIEFLEQPMPAGLSAAYREALPHMPFPLIADESIESEADFDELARQFSGVNVKLMKTGGTYRALELLKGAKARGLKTMLGCMVESSVGISSALRLCAPGLVDYADLDGFLLLKEDPFGWLREEDGILRTVAE